LVDERPLDAQGSWRKVSDRVLLFSLQQGWFEWTYRTAGQVGKGDAGQSRSGGCNDDGEDGGLHFDGCGGKWERTFGLKIGKRLEEDW